MDGVLVTSTEVWYRCIEEAVRRFGTRPVSREEFLPTFGQGTAADIPAFDFRCTAPELDRLYEDEFPRHLEAVWVNPEAAPLLAELKALGLRTAVVTNTVGKLTTEILRHAGLLEALPVRATSDRVAHAKPAPDLPLLACKELGVAPAEAWMVGDSRFDRGAAQAAGVFFVGFKLDGDARVEALSALPTLFA
jgi:HAD superfamily hydrolase (TIGR01509 family)